MARPVRRAKFGPVTLAQARALAKVRAPVQRGARAALMTASPANVGLERRKLELKQAQERRKRIKEYKATLAIMKKRGVKGLAPKTAKGGRAPKTTRPAVPRFVRYVLVSRVTRGGRLLPKASP